jgi:magnesium transporter
MAVTIQSSSATRALVGGYFQNYPGEAARLLNNLPLEEALRLIQAEPVSTAVEVIVRLNPDIAMQIIDGMEDEFFRQFSTAIDPARGAALLAGLDKERFQARLALLPPTVAKEYMELMTYPPESAGFIMDSRVTTFRPDDRVEEVLTHIRRISDRRIVDICIVDDQGHLIGTIPLQEVAISQFGVRLGDLVRSQPISVQAMSPREDVVRLLEDQKPASVPVIDIEGRLLGIIRHDMLVIAAKHDVSEDLQTIFGAGRDERALSKVSFAVKKRLPWLEINLVTAFLASSVIGLFEDTIARITALAVFLPMVAGPSGNTGSQALAVTMRGLALREIRTRHWFRIVRKEIVVGFINGCIAALTTALALYIWTGSFGLPVVIGLAMIFSMTVACLSGAIIPVILKTLGQDPASSSSIFLTAITDIVGFMSFLGLAKLLSGLLHIS